MKNQTATEFTASNIGERISITDELREWMKSSTLSSWTAEHLTAIADRIDVEHERITHNLTDALHKQEDATRELDEKSVLLPVDADGVPIHVGDVLDPPADCDDYVPLQVVRLIYDGYEQEWFFDGEVSSFCGMVGEHMDVAGWTHHHEPTVKDVLTEFANRVCNSGHQWGLDADDTIAEYAAKLRLAGDK